MGRKIRDANSPVDQKIKVQKGDDVHLDKRAYSPSKKELTLFQKKAQLVRFHSKSPLFYQKSPEFYQKSPV